MGRDSCIGVYSLEHGEHAPGGVGVYFFSNGSRQSCSVSLPGCQRLSNQGQGGKPELCSPTLGSRSLSKTMSCWAIWDALDPVGKQI
jgi:hypothetical protein